MVPAMYSMSKKSTGSQQVWLKTFNANHEHWTECQEKHVLKRRVLPANVNTQLAWRKAILYYTIFATS